MPSASSARLSKPVAAMSARNDGDIIQIHRSAFICVENPVIVRPPRAISDIDVRRSSVSVMREPAPVACGKKNFIRDCGINI